MTYISTRSMSLYLQQSTLQLQTEYAKAQTESSTGKVADLGLSLGASTGQTVSITFEQSQLQSITDSNTLANTRLTASQSALTAMSTNAQSVLNSLLSSASDTASLSAISAGATNALQALIGALNTTAGGQYIFGGINTDTQPIANYTTSPASASKQAVDSDFMNAFGVSQTAAGASSVTGTAMQSFLQNQFAAEFTGTSWTSNWSSASSQTLTSRITTSQTIGTSVSANATGFQKLAQAYTMLSEFGGGNLSAEATQAVQTTARSLIGSAIQDLTNSQTSLGAAQAAISQANDTMSAQITVLSTSLTNLEQVDPYVAATRVTSLQTQLQATYQLTTQLHQMSLLNYLPNN